MTDRTFRVQSLLAVPDFLEDAIGRAPAACGEARIKPFGLLRRLTAGDPPLKRAARPPKLWARKLWAAGADGGAS